MNGYSPEIIGPLSYVVYSEDEWRINNKVSLGIYLSQNWTLLVGMSRSEKKSYWRPTSNEKKTHLLHKISPNKKHASTARKRIAANNSRVDAKRFLNHTRTRCTKTVLDLNSKTDRTQWCTHI